MTEHPLLASKRSLLLFLFTWIIVILVHAWWLHSGINAPLSAALTDSFVYNLIFAFLSIAMWFPVRALYQTRKNWSSLAGGYLMVIAVTLILWLAAAGSIMSLLIQGFDKGEMVLNTLSPWRIITGFFYTLVISLMYNLVLYYEELREKKEKEAELRTMMAETEIMALKNQLNPHFLFNTLNTMGSLIQTDPDQAEKMIYRLSRFLRYSLRHEENKFVLLSQELEHIHDYLDLLRVRYGKKWNVTIETDNRCLEALIPPMILQPLIENAVQYAFGEQKENGWLEMKCNPGNRQTEIVIRNSFDPLIPVSGGHGIGLKNIDRRLVLIYEREDLLQVHKKENTFEIRIILPNLELSTTENDRTEENQNRHH